MSTVSIRPRPPTRRDRNLTTPHRAGTPSGSPLVTRETLPHVSANWETFFERMESGLTGARVLVTGGSGGIGAACVRLFAAEGAHVVVHYNTGP